MTRMCYKSKRGEVFLLVFVVLRGLCYGEQFCHAVYHRRMLPEHLIGQITRNVLFAHLSGAQYEALARQLHWMCLPGGQPLFFLNEPADALYILVSGSLGVFDRSTMLMHQIGPGECVGEMSLLSGKSHRFTVKALRDSELLRLDRQAFETLINRHPGAMLTVARRAIMWRRTRQTYATNKPRTFAILPVDSSVPARELATKLARALEPMGRCTLIDAAIGATRNSDWFAQHEAASRFVIYLDTDGHPWWRQRCLRQADVLLLPVHAQTEARKWPEMTLDFPSQVRHRPRHLLLLHPNGQFVHGAAQRWRAQFHGKMKHHHLHAEDDFARVARLISGHGRGLVLAGGGAPGLAHLGVVKALREAGYRFDAVGGTSMGAIVGASVAMDWDTAAMMRIYHEAFVRGRLVSDWTLPLVAFTRGRRASRMLRTVFGDMGIEDMPLPYFCISTDLAEENRAVHRCGLLRRWLRASSAIPGILPPLLSRGHVYVDGALLDNFPVDVMADDGIDHITAVSIHSSPPLRAHLEASFTPPWWRVLYHTLRRDDRRWPSLLSTLEHSLLVESKQRFESRRELASLLITPSVEHIGLLDWMRWDQIVAAGYREAVKVLDAPAASIDESFSTLADTERTKGAGYG